MPRDFNISVSAGLGFLTTCAWSVFWTDNGDGMDDAELAAIEARLRAGETVTIGGGAAPLVILRKMES